MDYFELCCSMEDILTDSAGIGQIPIQKSCGYRNEKGVAHRTLGTDGEAEFGQL